MNEAILKAVIGEIKRIFDVDATLEYPGYIAIPEKFVNDEVDASRNAWAVGPYVEGEPGEWTGNLLGEDGDVVGEMSFSVYPNSEDPAVIADAIYAHGIGDLYVGGGCPNCPYRRGVQS